MQSQLQTSVVFTCRYLKRGPNDFKIIMHSYSLVIQNLHLIDELIIKLCSKHKWCLLKIKGKKTTYLRKYFFLIKLYNLNHINFYYFKNVNCIFQANKQTISSK
jgi:hypothetical protein